MQVADPQIAAHVGGTDVTYTVETPADTTPPSAPSGLTVTVNQKAKQVQLAWNASQDNVGVAGYQVFRNGAPVTFTTMTTWVDTAWSAGATYAYSVIARDAAGNTSGSSNTVVVTLSGGGGGGKKR